jgi:tRNA(fMet)-specific endonuclease VapC
VAVRIIVDTNRYSDAARGDRTARDAIEAAEQTFLPIVVLGELRAGFRSGTRGSENERQLQTFLRTPTVHVLPLDEATTVHYGAIFQQLRQQGTPIPTNDMWIAALALQHGLHLFERDAHFDRLPQLLRI